MKTGSKGFLTEGDSAMPGIFAVAGVDVFGRNMHLWIEFFEDLHNIPSKANHMFLSMIGIPVGNKRDASCLPAWVCIVRKPAPEERLDIGFKGLPCCYFVLSGDIGIISS